MRFNLFKIIFLFFVVYAVNDKWGFEKSTENNSGKQLVLENFHSKMSEKPFNLTYWEDSHSAIENLVRPIELSAQVNTRTKQTARIGFSNIQLSYQVLVNSYYRSLISRRINSLLEDLLFLTYCKLLI